MLKTDPRWAEFHNDPLIGGFGVPWGPYGFNSGVTQEDVDLDEARELGLDVDSVAPKPAKITDGTQASTKKMDPAIKAKLLKELRSGPKPRDPEEAAREAAAEVRREMLSRGLADAEIRGDGSMAEKYRKAISGLLEPGMKVRDDGDKIVLEVGGLGSIIHPDERNTHIQTGKGQMGQNQKPDERSIALNIRAASKDVYPGWSIPHGDGDQGESQQRAIEAQIAAAVTGRKPLYFEPWGEEFSDAFAESYRRVIPKNVEVQSRDGMLFIYQKEPVRIILDSDPEFYRPGGESDIDAIARVSANGVNGELLGYGARSILDRPAHQVRIFKGNDILMYYFVSDPDPKHAAGFAKARTLDFERAFGWDDVRFELTKVD